MSKKFLICTSLEWSLLTLADQSKYVNHYETLLLCVSALTGVNDTEDYEIISYNPLYTQILNSQLDIDISLNGKKVYIKGFNIEDNVSSTYALETRTEYLIYENCVFTSVVDKIHHFTSVIMVDGNRNVSCHNCIFDFNGKRSIGITAINNAGTHNTLYRCVFKNGLSTANAGGFFYMVKWLGSRKL